MRLVMCLALCASATSAEPMFENHSDALPVHSYEGDWTHFVGGGVAVFDCNGDDLPDIFAAGGENPAQLIINQGDFAFAEAGVPTLLGTTGAYPIDINADGYTDLFVLRAGPNRILRGGPDCGFTDATDAFGMSQEDRWSTAFTAWWDGDGWPTLAVGNYVDRSNPDGPFGACGTHHILRPSLAEMHVWNVDRTEFQIRQLNTYDAQTLAPGFCSLSMLAALDARGRPTLRISNDRHYYIRDGYEQMWDIAEQRFLGPDDGWPTVSLWGMGIASRDLTGDGRDEVMLTSMGDQLMQIAQSDGGYGAAPFDIGTYAQRPHTGGDGRPSTGWHAEFGDIDNNGRADLFIAKGNVDQMPGMATRDPNNLLIQQEDGTFIEASVVAGVASLDRSRGAALADFDGDGRLDLVVVNRRAPMELYRNVTPDTGHWVRVSLRQAGGNRDAIGAVVTLETAQGRQSIQVVVGGGHAGGQLLPRHFGLGSAQVAVVTVDWPDGTKSVHEAVLDSTMVIEKP